MMLARAELLQRRVTRSLQLLSSPHNNPDFPSPKPSPNDHVCKGRESQSTSVFMEKYSGTKSSTQGHSRPLQHPTAGGTLE